MIISILEDDLVQRRRLIRLINEIAEANPSYEIKHIFDTGKPQEIIDNIGGNRSSQMLYFLDIEIKGEEKEGLEVAKKIRALDRFATIVFVTTHSEFSVLTYSYHVSALHFLAKDQKDSQLIQGLNECLEYVQTSSDQEVPQDVFRFENDYRMIELPFSKILYFETFSQPHKLALIATNQRIEFYANLSEIKKMDSRFFRCHKSTVVNIENIVDIDRTLNQLKMAGGATCYLSKRKVTAIQKKRLALQSERR